MNRNHQYFLLGCLYKADADRVRLVVGDTKDSGEEMAKDVNSLLACRYHDANIAR